MQELEANARQFADGKPVKKTRPRRTVDYNGGLGRWTLVRSQECPGTIYMIHGNHSSSENCVPTVDMYLICGLVLRILSTYEPEFTLAIDPETMCIL